MRSRLGSVLAASAKGGLAAILRRRPVGRIFDRCVLHIGTEKTGTSAIQYFLASNRKAFARDGVLYPRATGASGGSQWGFVAQAHPRAWATDVGPFLGFNTEEGQKAYRDGFVAALTSEFRRAGNASTLVVSSEHMQSRLNDPTMIAALREFLDPWVREFRVVLYLRRQDRVSSSLYSTQVKSGAVQPVLFPKFAPSNIIYYYNYEKLYDNWCSVFGTDAVDVGLFSPGEWRGGTLISDFCSRTGLDLTDKRMPEAKINTSLDLAGTQFLLEVNRQLPNLVARERNRERDELAGLVAKFCVGNHVPATREQAQEFYRKFVEMNERLRRKVFPDRAAPLFDDDFSEYPETLDGNERRYEDAVALAIRLWRAGKGDDADRNDPRSSASSGR